jgi:hypothetical protein
VLTFLEPVVARAVLEEEGPLKFLKAPAVIAAAAATF